MGIVLAAAAFALAGGAAALGIAAARGYGRELARLTFGQDDL